MSKTINGRVKVNGRGRSGIAVSNGETVIRTDRGGHFRIGADPIRHRFVFVVSPHDATGHDSFFVPVDKLAKPGSRVDFKPRSASSRRRRDFSFAHLSDCPQNRIHLNLTQFGDVPSLKAFRRIVDTAPCPIFPMFGAHDGFEGFLSGKSVKDRWSRNYESILGPTYYSFNWGGRHFVLYPNEDAFFSTIDREIKSKWLDNDLQAHSQIPTLLFLHEPPTCSFLDRLVSTSVFAVLHGHWHSSKAHTYHGIQILHTSCLAYGGIDGSPRGGRITSFRRGRMTTQLVHVHNRPPQKKLPSPKPSPASRKQGQLRLLWSRRLDRELHRAAPVVVDKRVLLCPRDEAAEEQPGIVCPNLADGSDYWQLSTDASIKNSVSVVSTSQSSRATDRDRVAAISVTGRLFVFERRMGKVLWQVDLPEYPERWIYASPTSADSVVYAGGQAGFDAYRLSDGKKLWYYEPTDHRLDCYNCYAGPVVSETNLILFVQGRGLVALDRASGRERWWYEIKLDDVWMYPRPIALQGNLVAAGEYGELINLDLNSGQVLWRRWVNRDRHWDQTMTGLDASQSTVFLGPYHPVNVRPGRWRRAG